MANIAIVSQQASHSTPQEIKRIVLSGGHTCTVFNESNSTNLLGFDLIIATRISVGASANLNVVNAFKAGTPVLIGLVTDSASGLGDTATSLVGKLGLASGSPVFQSSSQVKSLTDSFSANFPINTIVNVFPGSKLCNFLLKSEIAAGAIPYFDHDTSTENKYSVVIAPKSSPSLVDTVFPAACGLAGFLYSDNTTATANGSRLILDIVDKILLLNITATHTISGYVLDENGEPLTNKVRLYNQVDGTLVDETTPDITGKYLFKVVEGEIFFIVCTSDNPNKNFKVHSFIQGVLV